VASVSVSERSTISLTPDRGGLVLLQLGVAFFVIVKLVYGVFVPPNGDEAYYWLWGGHLQLSYYDHGPMVGWASAIGRALLGWTPAGLHFPALASFVAMAFAVNRASRWIAPERSDHYFWTFLLIFSASPLLNALTTLNFPDHALICFGSIAMLQLGKYLNGAFVEAERPADLYLGAAFLGLAGLSKYSAVFIPAGLLVVLIAEPRLRRLFRSPHLYLAGALCLIIVSPVLIWNFQNHFVTVGLHAAERVDERAETFTPFFFARVVVLSIIEVSPFLVVGFSRFIFGRIPDSRQSGLVVLARGTAIASTLFFLPLAAWGGIGRQVAPHWLVLSFLPFMLVAPLYVRSWIIIALHSVWGALLIGLTVAYFVGAPLLTGMLGMSDGEASRTFGQEQLAAAVSAAVKEHDADLIVLTSYTNASRFAFGLGSDDMVSDFGGRVDRLAGRQFTAADAGKTMILVGRTDGLAKHFDTVEPIGRIETTRFGKPLVGYDLAVGRGFKP